MKYLALGAIRLYQKALSPLLPPSCRFEPSCSRYAYTAIERFGLLRGGWMAAKRLARCQPFYHGNLYDPVPELEPRPGIAGQRKSS
ncbi:MAG TPA: membrane protein insertion efficiency factor YidD [Ktedonobacterales bacterium]